jgi:hypothetical protein
MLCCIGPKLLPGGASTRVFLQRLRAASCCTVPDCCQVVLRGKALPGGKLMARGEWSIVDLLMASPPPPTTWLGVFAVSDWIH